MSRSGYNDDYVETWALIRWRGAVNSALRGKRGQAFLRELLAALDALPTPRLIPNSFVNNATGEYCALGAVARARGITGDLPDVEFDDWDEAADVGGVFGIADAMAREIMWMNDDDGYFARGRTPEERFIRVREWVVEQMREAP